MIKKLRALLLVVVLTMSLLHFPSVAEDTNDILLNGAGVLIEGQASYASVDSFVEALDLLNGLTLQVGSRGNYVAAFQSLLIVSGYLPEGVRNLGS